MKIIKLAKAKEQKSSAKVTKLEDGGYIISVAVDNDGYMECDSIMIPSGVKINLDDLKA